MQKKTNLSLFLPIDFMEAAITLVWYACYGSNIDEARFNTYIAGGQPKGAERTYPGCSNKTLPTKSEEIFIKSSLYFAKSSSNWANGGVAFLSNDFNVKSETWGRMYLITKEQFIDVVKQEINRENVSIDFEKAAISGGYVFAERSWYGRIVFLGYQDGFPIFTFTNKYDIAYNRPSPKYLRTIVAGIKQCYSYDDDEIADYLVIKNGIEGEYNLWELQELVKSVV